MCSALSLVLTVLFLTLQCGCQKIVEGDHRQYVLIPVAANPNYGQIDPGNQYQEQSQLVYSKSNNYPSDIQNHKSLRNHRISRLDNNNHNNKPQPNIEQYLKEVTPTTKTSYDPRHHPHSQYIINNNNYDNKATNIPASNDNNNYYLNQENSNPDGISTQLITSDRQYVKQPQQQPSHYTLQQYPQQQVAYKVQPHTSNQNTAVYQTLIYQPQQATQSSAIQYLPEKPATPKYKQSVFDEEINYLRKLQQQHQQPRQEKKKIQHSERNNHNNYQRPELIQPEYSIARLTAKPGKKDPVYDVPEYQQKVINFEYKNKLPSSHSSSVRIQPQAYGGPRYLPDHSISKTTATRTEQPQTEPSYFDNLLQKYGILFNEAEKNNNEVETRPIAAGRQTQQRYPQQQQQQQIYEQQLPPEHHQPDTKYIQIESPTTQQSGSQQQPQQQQQPAAYQGPTDEEYKQSQFKQSLGINSSLRILKTGKPVVFIGHEE